MVPFLVGVGVQLSTKGSRILRAMRRLGSAPARFCFTSPSDCWPGSSAKTFTSPLKPKSLPPYSQARASPMSDHAPDRIKDPHAHSTAGLRLRLWLACLGGALVAAGGIWWVIGTQTGPGARVDLALVVSWLGAVAGLALIVGAALALWLD